MIKIVAVFNDNTGKCVYVLNGYENLFPAERIVDSIETYSSYGEIGEYDRVKVKWDSFIHFITSEQYSCVYREEAE